MDLLLQDKSDTRAFLLGNEAVVRGAIEAGVGFVATYPGTPASEIGDTFYRLSRQSDIYFEYSVNEKVAFEMAIGASLSGLRTLCSMKHLGLNVAADPFVTLAYIGVVGGFVVVSAGDPSCHTSPNEQDQRYFAQLANIPFLEPSSPDESRRMMVEAFNVSEKFRVPVLFRINTRVSHTRGMVTLDELRQRKTRGEFVRDFRRFVPIPANARALHGDLVNRMKQASEYLEMSVFNEVSGNGETGIIGFGESINYVRDAVNDLGITDTVKILKLGISHPFPEKLCRDFLTGLNSVLVVEELEPVIETIVRGLAAELPDKIQVYGKGSGQLGVQGEYTTARVRRTLVEVFGYDYREHEEITVPDLPVRPPSLCPGCPHRTTFYSLKTIADPSTLYINDIGCYTLGGAPPLNMADNLVSMGSSIPIASSVAVSTGKKTVAFIGDSTFIHSGITGLINAVSNNHDVLVIIMDNRTTAMTGFQPHPGISDPGAEEPGRTVSIEKIVKAIGVNYFCNVDPENLQSTYAAIHKAYHTSGVSVVISTHACPISEFRYEGKPIKKAVYAVDPDKCKTCGHGGDSLHCGLGTCKVTEMNRSLTRVLNNVYTSRTLDRPDTQPKFLHAPCTMKCPVNICIDGFISRLGAGEYREALHIIMKRLPFPGICGRVCHRPCEQACIRNRIDGAVSIAQLRRFITDLDTGSLYKDIIIEKKKSIVPNGRKVAVIGSGPAGLSAAYELALRGYAVTVFESERDAGGILAWGIPDYRLPKKILKRELNGLKSLGINIKTGVAVGKDVELNTLFNEGYEAVFLGLGAQIGMNLGIEGEDLTGVMDALKFLKDIHYNRITNTGEKVAVIGGGDAAFDAARSAKRLGSKHVMIIYRRSEIEMPANPDETAAARQEGIEIRFLETPVRFLGSNGKLTHMELVKMQLGQVDSSGRRRPVPVEESEFTEPVDQVIIAIGQQTDLHALENNRNIELTPKQTIVVDTKNGATSDPRIFAGGDVVTGPSTVLQAIAAGKKAAYGIDLYLSENKEKVYPMDFIEPEETIINEPLIPPDFEQTPRVETRQLSPEKRIVGFVEVNKGYTRKTALKEAARCLQCGLCGNCNHCIDHFGCPAFALKDGKVIINPSLCTGCGICAQICPNGAIYLQETLV